MHLRGERVIIASGGSLAVSTKGVFEEEAFFFPRGVSSDDHVIVHFLLGFFLVFNKRFAHNDRRLHKFSRISRHNEDDRFKEANKRSSRKGEEKFLGCFGSDITRVRPTKGKLGVLLS